MFNIVLVEPEIPANTGNIARTCAVTGCNLHLIEPLGFSLEDKYLKRAGLDYWSHLNVFLHPNLKEFLQNVNSKELFLITKQGKQYYTQVKIPRNAYLFFGKETAGLPVDLLKAYPERSLRIPMFGDVRSLNLSNSVAILVYEAFRQHGFWGLK